jgi:DNA-binding response OmpR family regulator
VKETRRSDGARAPNRGSPRILVLERDLPLATLLQEWLAAAGYSALLVRGAAAPRLDEVGAVTAVIADLDGPRDVALAELKRLRQAFPRTPIVVMSAHIVAGAGAAREVARDLGVASVLAKPFSSDTLLAAVRQASGSA